jgi:hypothetical protein
MITLIVEDGTGVANANTYIDVAYMREYAEIMGIVLDSDDEKVKAQILQAMPFIEGQPYTGQRSDPAQALAWPRKLATIDCYSQIADSIIPEGIKRAQAAATALIVGGVDLYPVIEGQFITKEKVGPIETEYSDEFLATVDGMPVYGSVMTYLNQFFCETGGYRLSRKFGF